MGGAAELHVMEFANAASITETAGVVTTITKATAKQFYKYVLPRETGSFKDSAQASEANGSLFYKHAVKMVLNKLQSTLRNELLLIAKNKLLIVAKDRNGKYWLLGKTGGMFLTAQESGSGTAAGDRSGYDLDFEGTEPEPMVEVDAATAATLETPGV